MSGKRTLGVSRNRFPVFAELRRELRTNSFPAVRQQTSRFSKQRLVHGVELELVDQSAAMKKPFIEDLSSVSTIDSAKPQWMAHHEECQQLLRAVEELRREMLMHQNKRLTCVKVSEEKGYEMKIYDCAREATARIKRTEMILGLLTRQAEHESPANARICKSITFKLATDIQQATKLLRGQQRSFVQQRKQFEATEKASFLEVAAERMLEGSVLQDDLVQDEAMLQLQSRNEQIKKIVQSIYELNDIYKELNSLVILQGSLLDRIDQNIDAAQQAVASGAEHLTKAERRQKRTGRCACGVILGQLVAIGILLIVLMSKWMR